MLLKLSPMLWSKRKRDPVAEREKSLAAQLAALEQEIKRLDTRLQRAHSQPRAPARRGEPTRPATTAPAPPPAPDLAIAGPNRGLLHARQESPTTPQHYNDLGVRKYDLVALIERVRNWFRGPAPANPQLLKMLAAGNIEGLRPLRIEKRKARRRFLLLATLLFVVLLGIISVFIRHS